MRRKKASEKEKGRVRKERKKDSENEHAAAADSPAHRELKDRIYLSEFNHREVERRAVAIRAIRDAQIERILTQLRMARSIFSEEQLNMPLVEFLKKYCPNTEAVRNSDGVMEMRMKGHVLDAGGAYNEGRGFRDSIGCQASVGCGASDNIDGQAFAMPTPTCFPFMDAAAQGWSAMNATQLTDEFLRNIGMYNNQSAVFEGNSEIKVADRESSILTPQTELKMQSVIGVTPKSQRLPRRGEMLMSIHGSPLGFYAEDKMDTICERYGIHICSMSSPQYSHSSIQWQRRIRTISGHLMNLARNVSFQCGLVIYWVLVSKMYGLYICCKALPQSSSHSSIQ